MSAKPISAELQEKIRTFSLNGFPATEIAARLGINRATVRKYKSPSAPRNRVPEQDSMKDVDMPVDNRGPESGETVIKTTDRPRTIEEMAKLFKIDLTKWVAEGIRTNEWQGFYKVKTPDGHKKVSLWQTRVSWRRIAPEPVEKAIKNFIEETIIPASPIPRSKGAKKFAVSWGLWDAHLGCFAWAPETGEHFDLNIAVARVMNSIDDIVEELKPYGVSKIWMPVGNDFLHFDSIRHKTALGEHFLDVDTRYAKVYEAGLRCLSYMVEKAAGMADEVDVIHIPGNHDTTSSYTLCVALQQRFRKTRHVRVDTSPNPRKYRSHGGTLLGFDHGQAPAAQLAQVFSSECRDIWSRSTYREIQVGHTHQRHEKMFDNLVPTNGVLVRTNPSLCSADIWHHRQGFIGEPMKSVEAYRYDEIGFKGSHVAWARDQDNPQFRNVFLD